MIGGSKMEVQMGQVGLRMQGQWMDAALRAQDDRLIEELRFLNVSQDVRPVGLDEAHVDNDPHVLLGIERHAEIASVAVEQGHIPAAGAVEKVMAGTAEKDVVLATADDVVVAVAHVEEVAEMRSPDDADIETGSEVPNYLDVVRVLVPSNMRAIIELGYDSLRRRQDAELVGTGISPEVDMEMGSVCRSAGHIVRRDQDVA